MKSVSVKIHRTKSPASRGGTYVAQLEDDFPIIDRFAVLYATSDHETWSAAAAAALHIADSRGYIVFHRGPIESRIRREGECPL